MCGVRKLTHTAYAISAYDAYWKLRQSRKAKAEYDDRATWSNPQWRVFIIHVFTRAFGDASNRRECLGTRHFFLPRRGCGCETIARQKEGELR